MGKGTFKAYEKSEWGGDVVGAWGALILFPISTEEKGNNIYKFDLIFSIYLKFL